MNDTLKRRLAALAAISSGALMLLSIWRYSGGSFEPPLDRSSFATKPGADEMRPVGSSLPPQFGNGLQTSAGTANAATGPTQRPKRR